jgi:hypothetical protein
LKEEGERGLRWWRAGGFAASGGGPVLRGIGRMVNNLGFGGFCVKKVILTAE